MQNIILLTILLICCAGCVLQAPAPIEFNPSHKEATINSFDVEEEVVIKPLTFNDQYSNTKVVTDKQQNTEIPVAILGAVRDNTKIIYHEVQNNETLRQLAEHYNTSQEKIIKMNDLAPPYKLEELQILKIAVSSDILNKKHKEQAQGISKDQLSANKPSKDQPNDQPNDQLNDQPLFTSTNFTITNHYIKPVTGDIIVKFGEVTRTGKSNGINIAAKAGTPVRSIANGIVIRAGNNPTYGNLVIIKLDDSDLSVAYAHLTDLILTIDQKVSQGDIIGYVGSTGGVEQAQLYFAIKDNDTIVDPLKIIKSSY